MNQLITNMLRDLENGISKSDVQYYYFGKPLEPGKDVLNGGAIMVMPVSTETRAVTTGITDEDLFTVQIMLAKNLQAEFYRNAQKESGAEFLTRVMEGRDSNGVLQTNTIKHIVRSNFRQWGLKQEEVGIEYDTNDVSLEGAATAVMTVTQLDHTSQSVN